MANMNRVDKVVNVWEKSLVESIDLGGLFSRDPVAHKWKATYRITVLRELTFWRVTDLLKQTSLLVKNDHLLGARILLRSTIETVGILIYLNVKIKSVLEGDLIFDELSKTTSKLMLGSKNESTKFSAINVVTILNKHCEKRYEGISQIYDGLSETAHPNYDGVCSGYSHIDEEEYVTHFKNQFSEKYNGNIEEYTIAVMKIFEEEYNNVWPQVFEQLEKWLVENNERLEAESVAI